MSWGMRIAVSSGLPFSRVPVLAMIVTPPVMSVPEFVIHFFDPLMTHSPPTSSAVVRVPPASLPASSSVRPNAQRFSPAAHFGERQAEQAEAGHIGDYVVGEPLLAVEFCGAGPDLTLGEVACEVSP